MLPWVARNSVHYVAATNETHTILKFVEAALGPLDFDRRDDVERDARCERPAGKQRRINHIF